MGPSNSRCSPPPPPPSLLAAMTFWQAMLVCPAICMAGLWLSQQVDVRWRGQALPDTPQQASAAMQQPPGSSDPGKRQGSAGGSQTPGHDRKGAAAASPYHAVDRDAWRAAVGSPVVADAWERLSGSIVQEVGGIPPPPPGAGLLRHTPSLGQG